MDAIGPKTDFTLETNQSVTNIFEYWNIFDPNIYSDIRSYHFLDLPKKTDFLWSGTQGPRGKIQGFK